MSVLFTIFFGIQSHQLASIKTMEGKASNQQLLTSPQPSRSAEATRDRLFKGGGKYPATSSQQPATSNQQPATSNQ